MIKLKASLCKNCKPKRNHDTSDEGCKFYSYKFTNKNEKINLKRILVKPYDFILEYPHKIKQVSSKDLRVQTTRPKKFTFV
ncbi:hypothetical protein CONCODRAFT_7292 [Conidiobolus coronatus NRRL 28638]|uniref:Uncharacterized protein n=1 Tax=Conidiobolus coronatus (strain ATCC 28846 / CBS 209.66 / NRRL 28638) TaxID=796925 RepID=A0A137P572_CONC2|nr:hypothetical protein CONCODRAFT_7292 [Conidiobolus coronatus NRRL 28638]|eukprot:KXN70153.1 hypothetical protein CONCODRAFT_7292 [Conidiobolus coronatus NRRL 28638]